MPRTRSQSGYHATRQIPNNTQQNARSGDASKQKKTKRHTIPDSKLTHPRTGFVISKPRFKYDPKVVEQESPSADRDKLLAKVEECASKITPTLQRLSPELVQQVDELRKFKIFKTFNVDMQTLRLLESEIYEMTDKDNELDQLLQMEDGQEQDEKFWQHYGLKLNDDIDQSFIKKEEIEELSLSNWDNMNGLC